MDLLLGEKGKKGLVAETGKKHASTTVEVRRA
jgi:hypothetical protein